MYWTGKEYDKDGNLLNEYKNGSGHIKTLNEEGILTFEGEYLNGKKNGQGKLYSRKPYDYPPQVKI